MAKSYAALRLGAIAALVPIVLIFAPVRGNTDEHSAGPTICVVVPHFKDEYWLSVGFGLQQEAAATNVRLRVYESGGYHALAHQIELLDACIAQGAKAILFGAVSADDTALLDAIEKTSQTVPVLALVNELRSEHLKTSIGVDWRDMGATVGQYMAARHPSGSPPMRAAVVTGPADSGWSPLLEAGLQAALASSSVRIVETRHADTGLREQLREVEAVLAAYPNVDYLIGSAPATEGAMGLRSRATGRFPDLIATYISHSVRRGLQGGSVQAVPFDDPVQQGRLGLRAALNALSGSNDDNAMGLKIRLIETGTQEATEIELSPAGFALDIE